MTTAAWQTHRRQLDEIVRKATRMLLDVADSNPTMSVEELRFYTEAVIDLYGSAAAESALQALEESRRSLGVWASLPDPVLAPLPPAQQVAGSVAWAASQTDGDTTRLARVLAGPLGRLIQQPARFTVSESTSAAGTRWARLPGPTACHFCLMLASRGAAYLTSDTASLVTTRSATQPQAFSRNPNASTGHMFERGRAQGMRFHDNCTCTIIESHSDADIPDVINKLQEEWYEVTWDDNGPVAGQAAVWRQHIADTRPNGETLRPDTT